MIYKQATTNHKTGFHTGSIGFSAIGLMAKLRNLVKIEVPVGYQDETGFHYGVKAAEKQTSFPSAC